MNSVLSWIRSTCIALVATAPALGMAQVSSYPTKPITIVAPYPPGGSSDVIARLIGQKLSESLKQAVVVDNKPGGLTFIGTQAVQKAPPDGHTLLLADNPFVVNAAVMTKLPYDPLKAFDPIAKIGTSPQMILAPVHGSKSALQDLVTTAKGNPRKVSVANAGAGSLTHLVAEVLQRQAGVVFTHIPYRGSPPALADAAGGQVDAAVSSYASAKPLVESGRLRILAVATASRGPSFPEVPTFEELGYSGLVIDNWWGMLAPAGTPPAVIEKLRNEIAKIISAPDVKAKFEAMNVTPQAGSAADFRMSLEAELKYWSRVAKDANIIIE